jgi:hypothetical protein
MNASQSETVSEDLREALKRLPVAPTEKFLVRVAEEITKREQQAGEEAYAAVIKKVRAQQLDPQQLVITMLELLATEKPKRGRPAKGAATKPERPEKVVQSSDSTKSEDPGVSGANEA